ncbi:MAG: hypothetical protein IKY21_04785 [Clostridia bacterium]|jgi:hypothetical protein|nr:hypothetical protein [Clostridia bacterium]MBR5779922.1 hypothetical protein [Clostridia bacterium]
MRCGFAKTVGLSALTFGSGVLLCLVLPVGALVFVEATLIVGAGAVLFIK